MSSIIDEIILLRASTLEEEFEWNGTKEDIDQWQSFISKYEDGERIQDILSHDQSDIPITIRLKLLNELWLNVNYRLTAQESKKEDPELTLCGPSTEKRIWDKASNILQNLINEAKKQEVDNIVFDVFTGLQADLSLEKEQIKINQKAELNNQNASQTSKNNLTKQFLNQNVELSRVIFWTHHLKAPSKKRDLNKWCQELQIWGLVKSGYPGFLCFEGLRENVDEIVKRIKSLQWHAITVKTEIFYFFESKKDQGNDDDQDIFSKALRNCNLAKNHSSKIHQIETNLKNSKIRTSMDEVESSGVLVQRLRDAGVPEDEFMFALNLRD